MNPNQALWEKSDFTRIAATMRESGEALVAGLGITPGMKVLDLGCGDGTTALPAARRGADVLGVDIARNLVEAGNTRAQAEGLTNCRFQQGDATTLSALDNHSFDLVVSILRRHVRAQTVRRRQGDGARHAARRSDRDGKLDTERPTLVAQILRSAPPTRRRRPRALSAL
jgi:SAM-dependent methyltransferase